MFVKRGLSPIVTEYNDAVSVEFFLSGKTSILFSPNPDKIINVDSKDLRIRCCIFNVLER